MMHIKSYKAFLISCVLIVLSACAKDEVLKESQLDLTNPPQSALDNWIATNYVDPYNIRVQYKWDQNLVDNSRYLFPPTQEKVQPVLEIVKKIWLDTYATIGGANFVKLIAPREIVLVGGRNLNSSGTITLGIAEGGQRITLFETDQLNKTNREEVKRFVHTIQHEYAHILNQYKPFDETSFALITPTGYTASWFNTTDAVALEQGYITAYAKSNILEDFAEMTSIMLINSKTEYATILAGITSTTARENIQKKEALVVKYFKDQYKIDFYKLRDEAEKNTTYVINN